MTLHIIATGGTLDKHYDELTGEVLGRAGLLKTIVLTGAMIPYAVDGSDAQFNLGFACGVAQVLPPGVYIAMNGQVFDWDKVRKNRSAGVFESTV
jgi:L-asparaginase